MKNEKELTDGLHVVRDGIDAERPYSLWGNGLEERTFATAQEVFDFLAEQFPNGYSGEIII